MAKKITTVLIGDIDEGPASETVAFASDEINYEINLSIIHASELRENFRRWTEAGRRMQRHRRCGTGIQIDYAAHEYNHKVHRWTLERDIDVNDHGRVPSPIMEQYKRENGR